MTSSGRIYKDSILCSAIFFSGFKRASVSDHTFSVSRGRLSVFHYERKCRIVTQNHRIFRDLKDIRTDLRRFEVSFQEALRPEASGSSTN